MVNIMAKKKRSKESANSFSYSIELTGIILLLIGIIGMGFGPMGKFVKEFAMFLAGEFYFIVLILLIILGIHMLFKRKNAKVFFFETNRYLFDIARHFNPCSF